MLLLKLNVMSTGKCMARQSMQPALHHMHTKPSLPGSQNSTWIKIENTRSGLAKVQRSGQERREPSLWRTNNQAAGLPGTGRPAAFPIIRASGRASSLTTFPRPLPPPLPPTQQGLTSRQSNRIHHRKNSRPSTKLHFHICKFSCCRPILRAVYFEGEVIRTTCPIQTQCSILVII